MRRTASYSATTNGCCPPIGEAITTNTPFPRLARITAGRVASSAAVRFSGPTIVTTRTTTTPVLIVLLNDIGINGMSDNIYAHDSGVATDLFAAGDGNLFQRVMKMRAADQGRDKQDETGTAVSSNEEPMSLFRTVRPNIVQSIRAFRVQDLADEASELGQ